jgi:hypothetical protein
MRPDRVEACGSLRSGPGRVPHDAAVTATPAATVSVRGRRRVVPAIPVGPDTVVVVRGRVLRIGEVRDEFWLPARDLPEPTTIIGALRRARRRPDLFTFAEKLPDVAARHAYHRESDNLAVASFDSYAEWFEQQVDRSVRKHVRKAAREGVGTEELAYTDRLVQGISEIYNETPVRQGRPFWHFGKPLEVVRVENGTYLDRSIFIGALYRGALIGFLKLVFDGGVAAIMQILSKAEHADRRPTNALLARAVEVCAHRQARHLVYGAYVYGGNEDSSLTVFKRNNGFVRVDVPRYYIPLSARGRVALRLGLHRGLDAWMPASVRTAITGVRARWYRLRR